MDVIILIVVLGIVSSLARTLKKPTERQPKNVASGQMKMTNTKPSGPGASLESTLLTGPLGHFLQQLTGEDQSAQKQRTALSNKDRLYREKQLEEQRLHERESEEKSIAEALKWENEMKDTNEISDLPELQDFITDEQLDFEASKGMDSQWNLSEAQKGIIWSEILEHPKFKSSERKHFRR